ncbi:MAG TPA: hypothetical protein VK421_06020 [Pyrinomonadaceae bacterium]|nr:hypothetical protein [Pyrinomonadaceae bacterium]
MSTELLDLPPLETQPPPPPEPLELADEVSDESESEAPAEYDATERQRIPAILATEDGAVSVTLVFEPCAKGKSFDHHLREYVRRLSQVRETETDEGAVLAREEAQLAAAEWLFDAVVTDIEGLGDEDEKPDDWKMLIGAHEKRNCVDSAILYTQTLEDEKAGGKVSWKSLGLAGTRLRCLSNGREVVTRHTLKKADAKVANEFLALFAKVASGGTLKQDVLIFDLAALYDRLKIGARGYRGGVVPAHHKAPVVTAHVTRQLRAVRKN